MGRPLDEVDRGILHLLQLDARNTTAKEIGDIVGVSPSTVRNRIETLEDEQIIKGYVPKIDYEAAGYPLRTLFVISASPNQRGSTTEPLLAINGVIDVREMLTAKRNLYVEVVGGSSKDLIRISDAIHDLGLEIESSEIVRQHTMQPFDHFHLGESGTEE